MEPAEKRERMAKRERKLEAIRVVDILRDQGLDLADIYGVMVDIAEVLAETAAQAEEIEEETR